jgi:hypothetical protein
VTTKKLLQADVDAVVRSKTNTKGKRCMVDMVVVITDQYMLFRCHGALIRASTKSRVWNGRFSSG